MTENAYNVMLLVEQALTAQDARQVRSLHEEIEDPVRYHVLMSVDEFASGLQGTVASLGSADMMTTPAPQDAEVEENLQNDLLAEARTSLDTSVRVLREAGATADADLLCSDPVTGLVEQVHEHGADEVIVMTLPHVVAEFFHVDWTSRARRKLDVPVLHLLEHETFDEQAESYGEEGVTGF